MNTGRAIRKILFISMWLIIGGGMVILLAAAMRRQKNERCKDYEISIKGKPGNLFIDAKDIQQLLAAITKGKIKGELLSSFNLNQMERVLKGNSWINDANLYFDNRDVLHITVTEKEPVARIFTNAGTSWYIDQNADRMPLSDKMSARVPVFTGFPVAKIVSMRDSLLLRDVSKTAQFILNDPFWMAQVSQIDITAERNFEMIPVVGNHIIRLGNAEGLEEKFRRLFIFYTQVISQTGFEKYKMIDVQYAGQVVASRQAGNIKVDSIQLRKNVEKLLEQARAAQTDTALVIQPLVVKIDSTNLSATENNIPSPSDPNPVKTTLSVNPPKAVMPKRNN